jgi:arylsulfatase A
MNSIFTGPVKFLALIGLCLPSSAMAEDGKPPRPNIIVILADDLGYGDISAFGSQVIDTPNIDRLAKEGVTMTSWYAAQNVCTPSRAGLLTGRYAPRSGTQFVTRPHSTWGMAPGEVTIAEMLKDAGYATGMIGKWHLGHRLKFWPTNQGFESFLGVAYSNDMQPFDLYRGTVMVEKDIDQSRLTDKYAAEAARFIRVNKDRPFFLYYSSSFPHYPAIPAQRNIGRTQAGDYGDTVATIDDAVGQVLDTLEEEGIADNTLILFTSDNGPWFQGSPGPLRARKGETYEGGYRVPFLARWPVQIPAGLVNKNMAMAIDLLPSFARLAGGKVPSDRIIDGMDISKMWTRGADSPHETLYFFDGNDLAAVRDGRFKLVLKSYYRSGVIPFRQFAGVKLFDLQLDENESYDVGNRNPEVRARLLELAEKMEAATSSMATKPDPVFPSEGAVSGPRLSAE